MTTDRDRWPGITVTVDNDPVDPRDLEGPLAEDPAVAAQQLQARIRADVETALRLPVTWFEYDLEPLPANPASATANRATNYSQTCPDGAPMLAGDRTQDIDIVDESSRPTSDRIDPKPARNARGT